MTQLLPRFTAAMQRIEDERKLARIILDTGSMPTPTATTSGTAAGDSRKLRGIPAIGRGVTGAIPGTTPHKLAA